MKDRVSDGRQLMDAVRDGCEVCHGTQGGVPGNENIINGRVLCDYCSVKAQKSHKLEPALGLEPRTC